MNSKNQLRLLKIDAMIQKGLFPNCQTLQEELNISERTALRDIDLLKEVFLAPIKYSKSKNGYYYSSDFSLDNVKLTEGDLLAVMIGRHLVDAYQNTPYHESMQNAYHKLSKLLPDYVQMNGKEPSPISIELFEAMRMNPGSLKIFQTIQETCSEKKKLKIESRDTSKKNQSLTVCPYKLTYMSGAWYLTAYLDEQKKFKHFLIRKMVKVRKMNQSFEELDLKTAYERNIPKQSVQERIVIKTRFSHRIADLVVDRLVGMETAYNLKGDLIANIVTDDVDAMFYWLLSFGSNVEVLEPVPLRLRFRKELVSMVSMY